MESIRRPLVITYFCNYLWKTSLNSTQIALKTLIKGLLNVYALNIPLLRMFSGYYPLVSILHKEGNKKGLLILPTMCYLNHLIKVQLNTHSYSDLREHYIT